MTKGLKGFILEGMKRMKTDMKLKCPECGREFKNSAGLGGHRAAKHRFAKPLVGDGKITLEQAEALTTDAYGRAGYTEQQCLEDWAKHLVGCGKCRATYFGALEKQGFTVTKPQSRCQGLAHANFKCSALSKN